MSNLLNTVSLFIEASQTDCLSNCLHHLKYQTTAQFEVIVINGFVSSDQSVKNAKHVKEARELAAGDIFVFMPDTVVLHDDFIENLLHTYNQGQTFVPTLPAFQVCVARLDKPETIKEAVEKIRVEKSQKKSTKPFLPYILNSSSHLHSLRGMPRLHIVIVSNEFTYFTHNGGVGTLYYQLASALLQMGHSISVVSSGTENAEHHHGRFSFYSVVPQNYFHSDLKIPVYCKNMNWSLSAAKKVMEIHAQQKIDVIESALWDVEAYALTKCHKQFPVIIRLVTPLKIAQRINQFDMTKLDIALGIAAEKTLLLQADALAVISENIGETIQAEYEIHADARWHRQLVGIAYRPEATIKPSAEQLSAIDQRLAAIPATAFKVLFIGRLEMRKGIDILLNAAWECLKTDDNIYFIFAGRNSQLWQAYVKEKLGTCDQDHLIFLDEIPLEIKDPLYAFSDVVTFPSRFESFGMVGLETTVHGKPIIAAEAGGIPEVVEHEVNGLLFPIGDIEALTEAILRLKNDKMLYAKLAQGAREKRQLLSARNMAIESVKLYAKLTQHLIEHSAEVVN